VHIAETAIAGEYLTGHEIYSERSFVWSGLRIYVFARTSGKDNGGSHLRYYTSLIAYNQYPEFWVSELLLR
jgi:hypothetical protein